MHKISVVIITYNRSKELKLCLDSIFKQTHKPFEIIIINNYLNDKSINKVKIENPEIIIHNSEYNWGVIKGRNYGYQIAKGDICVTIDDDAYLKNKDSLEKIEKYFAEIESLACVSFAVENANTAKIEKKFIPRRDRRVIDKDEYGASFVGTGHAIRKDVFINLGCFWEKLGMYFGEEPDLSYRILESGYKILHSSSVVVSHFESKKSRPKGRRIYYGTRNTPWIALKSLPWYSFVSLTILAWGYFFIQSIKQKSLLDFLRGVKDSILGFKEVFKVRKKISTKTIKCLKERSGVYWY